MYEVTNTVFFDSLRFIVNVKMRKPRINASNEVDSSIVAQLGKIIY